MTTIAGIVSTLGGNANVGGIFTMYDGVTNTSGRASAWQDARLSTYPTVLEVSGSGPTIDPTGLIFSGSQYLKLTSALLSATDNWAIIVVRMADRTASTNQIVAAVGDGGTSGYSMSTYTATGGPAGGTSGQTLGGLYHGAEWVSTNTPVTAETAGTGSNSVQDTQTFRRASGTGSTRLNGTTLTGSIADGGPSTPGAVTYIGWNGAHAKFSGVIQAVIFTLDPGGTAIADAETQISAYLAAGGGGGGASPLLLPPRFGSGGFLGLGR